MIVDILGAYQLQKVVDRGMSRACLDSGMPRSVVEYPLSGGSADPSHSSLNPRRLAREFSSVLPAESCCLYCKVVVR